GAAQIGDADRFRIGHRGGGQGEDHDGEGGEDAHAARLPCGASGRQRRGGNLGLSISRCPSEDIGGGWPAWVGGLLMQFEWKRLYLSADGRIGRQGVWIGVLVVVGVVADVGRIWFVGLLV